MPRKAPTDVNEHRITLGDYERNTLKEYIEKSLSPSNKIENQLAKQAPLILIAGGVGVAAYAFWRWAGLGSIIDRISETVDNVVDSASDAATFAQTGDITQTQVGGKIYQDLIKSKQDFDSKYAAKMAELELIKNDSANSANVRSQAEQDIQSLKRSKIKWLKKWNKAMAKIQP